MATIVSDQDLESQIAGLIDRALEGEEILIARGGTPVVRLSAVEPPPRPTEAKRELLYGLMKGRVRIDPSFFEPMTDEELELWYGKQGEPFP